MTFDQFQQTRKPVPDLSLYFQDETGPGYVYVESYYINEVGLLGGKYMLTIHNYSSISHDLLEFEKKLYDFAKDQL